MATTEENIYDQENNIPGDGGGSEDEMEDNNHLEAKILKLAKSSRDTNSYKTLSINLELNIILVYVIQRVDSNHFLFIIL